MLEFVIIENATDGTFQFRRLLAYKNKDIEIAVFTKIPADPRTVCHDFSYRRFLRQGSCDKRQGSFLFVKHCFSLFFIS
jgi:hypothetical protein